MHDMHTSTSVKFILIRHGQSAAGCLTPESALRQSFRASSFAAAVTLAKADSGGTKGAQAATSTLDVRRLYLAHGALGDNGTVDPHCCGACAYAHHRARSLGQCDVHRKPFQQSKKLVSVESKASANG